MPYPEKYKARAKKIVLQFIIINYHYHYQNLNSLLCGYYCLYFLNEMNKGKSFYKVLKTIVNN